ncbi:hypothetical protein BU16DRAFT_536168 [Lophium mytilinum]|uniref:F-box domain-containing protein n=1 Tax=Lophium mytilinum TaxID=390894 RepID=A0A6A6R6A9_9PEZI|nr:hypothetical protein BU16DRAFT_536168 [Lophium mytilinum]
MAHPQAKDRLRCRNDRWKNIVAGEWKIQNHRTPQSLLVHHVFVELSCYGNPIQPIRRITVMSQRQATSNKNATKPGKECASAASRVLHIPELAEMIFNELGDTTDLRHCAMVCRQWKEIVSTSPTLRRRMTTWWPDGPRDTSLINGDLWNFYYVRDLTFHEKKGANTANCRAWHDIGRSWAAAPLYQHSILKDKKFSASDISMCVTSRHKRTFYLSFKHDLNEPFLSRGFECETATCRDLLIAAPAPLIVEVRCTFSNISNSWDLKATISNANGVQIGDTLDCFRDLEALAKLANRMESKINILLIIGGLLPSPVQTLIFGLWLARMGSKLLIFTFLLRAIGGSRPLFGLQLMSLLLEQARAVAKVLRLRFGRNKIQFRDGYLWGVLPALPGLLLIAGGPLGLFFFANMFGNILVAAADALRLLGIRENSWA